MHFGTRFFLRVACALLLLLDHAAAQNTCVMCLAGKYKSVIDNSYCVSCGTGKYFAGTGATAEAACTGCPSNSNSPSTSIVSTACTCNVGYSGANGGTCAACTFGQYAASTGMSACVVCPYQSTTLLVGRTTLTSCTCNAGFTGVDGGTCSPCGFATYKTGYGSGSCQSCLTGSQCPPTSKFIDDCICNKGYTAGGGAVACSTCLAGKYKTVTGPVACTDSAAGRYLLGAGATSDTSATCPANSNSPAGTSALAGCTCNAGSDGSDGGPCTLCVAGKYKTFQGAGTCTDCGTGKYSTAVGAIAETTCSACPTNSNSLAGTSALAGCTCNAGSSGSDGGPCTQCFAGKYKTFQGAGTCTDCLAGTYSGLVGASTSSTCTDCLTKTFANSPVGSTAITACTCNAGHTPVNGGADGSACAACLAGQYKTATGSAACTNCGNATYSGTSAATTALTCLACTPDSTSAQASTQSTDCKCKAGFYTNNIGQPGATCSQCTAGTYNDALGKTVCSTCGTGLYSETLGAVGSETCLTCVAGKYSKATHTQCEFCPQYSSSPAGSGSLQNCTCLAGFFPETMPLQNGFPCFGCAAGKFKPDIGPAYCTNCDPDTYSTTVNATVATVCQTCTPNSASLAGSNVNTACLCKLGYTGPNGGLCTNCLAGKFKAVLGSTTCDPCPLDTYSGATAATASATCQTCTSFSQTDNTGSTVSSDCKCIMGYGVNP